MEAWRDLSQDPRAGIPYPQYSLPPSFARVLGLKEPTTPHVTQLTMCMPMGTHVDAPSHFIRGGPDIGDLPLERFILPGVVWAVSKPALASIAVRDLEALTPRLRRATPSSWPPAGATSGERPNTTSIRTWRQRSARGWSSRA